MKNSCQIWHQILPMLFISDIVVYESMYSCPITLELDSPMSNDSLNCWDITFETPVGKQQSTKGDICLRGRDKLCKMGEVETCAVSTRKSIHPLFIDEDSGLGMDTDMTEDHFQLSPLSIFEEDEVNSDFNDSFSEVSGSVKQSNYRSQSARKLFPNKRTVEIGEDDEELSPSMKRLRKSDTNLLKFALTNSPRQQTDDDVHCIIQAVDRLTTDVDLVADGSRDYSLPTITGKHGDLKSISTETLADVVAKTEVSPSDVMVIDCRYPYEYLGGHIKGAVNLYTKEEVHKLLELTKSARPRILVFHCEFSSERGPKMYRFLRSCDRELNKDNYPNLNFPEVYLLEGGYKEFYQKQQALCDPTGYKPMLHKDHASDLRHFRVKSKSWAGGKQRKHPSKSRLSRSCLSF